MKGRTRRSTSRELLVVMVVVVGATALMACSGGSSSGNTVPGAASGDSKYRELAYKSCDAQDTEQSGAKTTAAECRCYADIYAEDLGSYEEVTRRIRDNFNSNLQALRGSPKFSKCQDAR